MLSTLIPFRQAKVRRISPTDDFSAVQKIRHEVYCKEKHWLTNEQILDSYDQRAISLVVSIDGHPAATARMIDPRKGELEIFNNHPELKSRIPSDKIYFEASRLIASKKYRGYQASLLIFREIYKILVEQEADGIIICCPKPLVSYYENLMGFTLLSHEPLSYTNLKGPDLYPMLFERAKITRLNLHQSLGMMSIIGPTELLKRHSHSFVENNHAVELSRNRFRGAVE